MTQTYNYAVIGAGRQGTATAYDLGKWADAASIILADYDNEAAQGAAQRINNLLGREVASGVQLDVRDHTAVVELLRPVDVCVCGTPFVYILPCTKAALEAGTSMVDFGGHTDTVRRQIAMSPAAQASGISMVPDCGMGPGMNNTLGVYAIEQLHERGTTPREIRLWDGGLPQDPPSPWGYQCTFHINGLTNEYDGQALVLRDGKVTGVDTLTELEIVEFEGIGQLEAFVTSGGTSTVPYTYEGEIEVYENKTCRYPGHYAQFKAFKDLGLFSETPVEVDGVTIKPRELFHYLLAPFIQVERVIDVCVMRVEGIGTRDGQDVTFTVDLIDRYDETTGFTAMERLTGWHAGIMAEFIARGAVEPGIWPLEKAIAATEFVKRVRQRGFEFKEHWS